MIIVSSCLIGLKCRYDGNEKKNESVVKYLENKEFMPVCPEQMGGLSTPRNPAEIVSQYPIKIVNDIGTDVTTNFIEGVKQVQSIIINRDVTLAILKAKSPSCGSENVYDGTFSKKLIRGEGVLSKMLRHKGIKVINEEKVGSLNE